jgi:predicted enzyme related to lactoylglutathione lyase
VPSVDDYASRIVAAGGKVITPKTEIPDMGFIIVFLDTENNMFGLYEALKK